MNRRDSWHTPEEGLRSAQAILDGVMYELGERVASEEVRTEEMIRISGFFESAKAVWLATDSATSDPMPPSIFANRLRVLADICPPELRELGERLERALKVLEESMKQQKRA